MATLIKISAASFVRDGTFSVLFCWFDFCTNAISIATASAITPMNWISKRLPNYCCYKKSKKNKINWLKWSSKLLRAKGRIRTNGLFCVGIIKVYWFEASAFTGFYSSFSISFRVRHFSSFWKLFLVLVVLKIESWLQNFKKRDIGTHPLRSC